VDFRRLFSSEQTKAEFLDRFGELRSAYATATGGTESLEGGLTVDAAAHAVDDMVEGRWGSADPDLEAIIRRFTRPVQLVRRSTFQPPADDFPEAEEIVERLGAGRAGLEAAIPSSGRIDVRNHRLEWVGTGWVVRPQLVVTNRHVAEEFARADRGAFAFRELLPGRPVRAVVDWRQEYQEPAESRFRVREIVWIEPEPGPDVALIRLAAEGEDGESCPPPIGLLSEKELDDLGVGGWIAAIGYPARDSRNNAADQQRIFDGIYNCKRLAPGQISAITPEMISHDATTLGGNSGSALVDLDSGKAAALHFGGIEGDRNDAVPAPVVERIINDRAR
jgi:endonuclease G